MNKRKVSNRSNRSMFAILFLAVIGIFALTFISSPTNSRSLRSNTRNAMKFKFSKETLQQAADFQQQGQKFNSTIATALFEFENSKHSIQDYVDWSKDALCINDAMVIFTNVPDKIIPLRQHAIDKTIIVPMQIADVQVGDNILISEEQWELQNEIKSSHKPFDFNVNLFRIWAGKSWMATQAVHLNPFGSDVYHWMDIGHFRGTNSFCGETLVRHPEIVPQDSMMMFMRRNLKPGIDNPDSVVVEDMFRMTYIPGGWIAGRANVWPTFLQRFEETIGMYFLTGVSIVEDQAILESTCIRNEGLCSLVRLDNHLGYVDPSEQFEKCFSEQECKERAGWRQGVNRFFHMKYYFWHGGNFRFWDPSTGFPTEEQDFGLYHPYEVDSSSAGAGVEASIKQ